MPLTGRDADFYKVTLKSWLYEKIESNRQNGYAVYPGLEWLDEDRRYFKLPWVTENHPDSEKYYKIFHEWASREGKESSDPQRAKRNFRAALSHSKHFKHIRDVDLQTGSYKIYMFDKFDGRPASTSRNSSEDSGVSQPAIDSHYYGATPNNGTMEFSSNAEHGEMSEAFSQVGQFYNNLNTDQSQMHQWNQQPAVHMNISGMEAHEGDDVEMQSNIPSVEVEKHNSFLGQIIKDDKTRCAVTVEYNGRRVDCQEVCLSQGSCLIIYGDSAHVETVKTINWGRGVALFPSKVITLKPPVLETPGLCKILQNMNTGIHIWYNGETSSFYMMRECLAHVYCFNMHDKSGGQNCSEPLQIERKKHYLMLSYDDLVSQVLEEEFQPESLKTPADTVEMVVGILPTPECRGKKVKGVKISVQFLGANSILNSGCLSQEITLSKDLSSLDQQLAVGMQYSTPGGMAGVSRQ